jgi:hypothetical protein
MAPQAAETTIISRPQRGREEVPVQIRRLLHAHSMILLEPRHRWVKPPRTTAGRLNDLFVSASDHHDGLTRPRLDSALHHDHFTDVFGSEQTN